MNFEEIYKKYDFTESELLGMKWEAPANYILSINYYWDLESEINSDQPSKEDQFIEIILENCTWLNAAFHNFITNNAQIENFGTIVGWGIVSPSIYLEKNNLADSEWMHIFFEIAGDNKIEAICRNLKVSKLNNCHVA